MGQNYTFPLKTTTMKQLFWISVFLITITLTNGLYAQVVWQEDFSQVDKGTWADDEGAVFTDFTNVEWIINTDSCEFSDSNDYAKTVSTGNGRFEVLDSDGTVFWDSPEMNISNLDAVKIIINTGETGSSDVADKKFIKAYYVLDDNTPVPFGEVAGNWGEAVLYKDGIAGESLQLQLQLNSSYANDKVFVNDVTVEFVDSTSLIPSVIQVVESPYYGITGDTMIVRAEILNGDNEVIMDSLLQPRLLSQNLTVTSSFYNEGSFVWELLANTNGEASYSIEITDYDLAKPDTTVLVFNREDVIEKETFEGTAFQGWSLGDDWVVASEDPINGEKSLQHNEVAVSAFSEATFTGDPLKLIEEEYFFGFEIKNGDWNPSASNAFYLKLSDGNSQNENGYVFGVNAGNTSDLVSVWKLENGSVTDLLGETTVMWKENTSCLFAISRKPAGEWSLVVVNSDEQMVGKVDFLDADVQIVRNVVLSFNYTSTRAGELWFDDFTIIGQNAGPFVTGVEVVSDQSFRLTFSEAINWSKVSLSNFQLTDVLGHQIDLNSYEQHDDLTLLMNSSKVLSEANYIIKALNLADLHGKVTDESILSFENALPASEYDLVFNEIMADPTPPVALPEAEYLEILNRSAKYIQLEGFELFVRNSTWNFPRYLVAPGELLVLCEEQHAELLSAFGNVLAFDDFPSLLNSGALVKISDPSGNELDRINYNEEWYGDKFKADGGYSIERIDTERLCGQRGNWKASSDERGGTPGTTNSINASNIDITSPVALNVNIKSYREIEIVFNESIDSIAAVSPSNYKMSGPSVESIVYIDGSLYVSLHLMADLELNAEYSIEISGISDECGNFINSQVLEFSLLSYGPGTVQLSEVLFNPYAGESDFVEIKNTSGKTIDLAGIKLGTRDETLNLKSVASVSEYHIYIEPDAYVVLTSDSASIVGNYHVVYPENIVQMENFPAFNNDEGRVVVLSDSLLVIDEFAYTESMHSDWITSFDGVSLERISFDLDTNEPDNWTSASSLVGYATPTYENSQQPSDEELEPAIALESDVVSPNGDGYNDELIVSFTLDKTGYLANLFIFDAAGREVKRIANNDLIGNLNELVYDLKDDKGILLPMGAYMLFTELVNLDGDKKVFKTSFFVTDRM